jgi:hypothetical protein
MVQKARAFEEWNEWHTPLSVCVCWSENTSLYGRFLFGLMAFQVFYAEVVRVGQGRPVRRQNKPLGCASPESLPHSCGGV